MGVHIQPERTLSEGLAGAYCGFLESWDQVSWAKRCSPAQMQKAEANKEKSTDDEMAQKAL